MKKIFEINKINNDANHNESKKEDKKYIWKLEKVEDKKEIF